jgi:hypothetical protein
VNPRYPLFIVSKGRAESRYTSKALEATAVPYRIVVEEQEQAEYARVIDPRKIVVLDPDYQRKYDAFDDLAMTKSKGPGPARNFVWDLALSEGHAWHWVMDDNIQGFFRLNYNLKTPVGDGTIFRCMEDFVERYENVTMAGPNYFMFASRKTRMPPFVLNTRIYSCNLIQNAAAGPRGRYSEPEDEPIQYRWRGRYNEDTDLSLRMLKDGYCTVLFNAFLQLKTTTQVLRGGCSGEFYDREGTLPKSQMQVDMHPDVSRLVEKWGRWHHHVDYSGYHQHLVRGEGFDYSGVDDYGMVLEQLVGDRWSAVEPQVSQ